MLIIYLLRTHFIGKSIKVYSYGDIDSPFYSINSTMGEIKQIGFEYYKVLDVFAKDVEDYGQYPNQSLMFKMKDIGDLYINLDDDIELLTSVSQ